MLLGISKSLAALHRSPQAENTLSLIYFKRVHDLNCLECSDVIPGHVDVMELLFYRSWHMLVWFLPVLPGLVRGKL